MAEPDWKHALRAELDRITWDIERGHGVQGGMDYARQDLESTVFEAVEEGYQRGLMAGRSQAGYRTRRKPKEGREWSARSATDTGASAGEP